MIDFRFKIVLKYNIRTILLKIKIIRFYIREKITIKK